MKTLIIDNFDSFTFNLYQYVGELGGNPEVFRNNEITLGDIKKNNYSHIVISPGPGNPSDEAYFGVCREVISDIKNRIPLLGVCLGHQGIIHYLGGRIVGAGKILHGKKSLIKHNEQGIFKDVKNPIMGMRYHSLVGEKKSIPNVLEISATSDDGAVMGVQHKKLPVFGIQFHPESIGTEDGKEILKNFLSM